MKHLADLMTDETYLKGKSHNNDLICKGSSSMIVATAVMCTGRQGYLGYYAYWTRKNLRKTIDSTEINIRVIKSVGNIINNNKDDIVN